MAIKFLNTIAVDTNVLYVDASSNNVGIGTTSPEANLHVKINDSGATPISQQHLILENNSATGIGILTPSTTSGYLFFGDNNDAQRGFISYSHISDSMSFKVSGSEQMRIDSSGNVGIGTTSPGAKLEVNSGATNVTSHFVSSDNQAWISIQDSGSGTYGALIGTDSDAGNDFAIANASAVKTFVINSGNVGIGTTSPSSRLEIRATDATHKLVSINRPNSNTAALYIGNDSASPANGVISSNYSDLIFGRDQSSTLTEHMRIKRDGNVGIGTTSPLNKLHISTSDDVVTLFQSTDNVSKIEFADNNTTGNVRPSIGASGNNTIFTHGATERMRIDSSGNVGIGTTSPTYKLDVIGGARAGGVVTYSKTYTSLDTTGNAVAGLTTGYNGNSAGFTFTCFGSTGDYQKIVYSCYNGAGTWYTKKVIDEGTNAFDIEASANATTITFTFKSTSGTKNYSPRVTVEATGSAINSTYA